MNFFHYNCCWYIYRLAHAAKSSSIIHKASAASCRKVHCEKLLFITFLWVSPPPVRSPPLGEGRRRSQSNKKVQGIFQRKDCSRRKGPDYLGTEIFFFFFFGDRPNKKNKSCLRNAFWDQSAMNEGSSESEFQEIVIDLTSRI